ncbi:alpha/beta hydrolase [Leptospira langatensis]|uniref:Alpha/beta hydrolase n=1 Tax=Leptospira langatensis TaxID=2484983 RepID=A0A5F1ZZG8_9LEPT|nr:alpha/beta hydrolase [Leptospira langatensis]TGJ98539.1 alpha/beta hydrolase [Leptospira langatensis]TGL43453.1 alpha/beta hydrolase [Leptospira langatensis]
MKEFFSFRSVLLLISFFSLTYCGNLEDRLKPPSNESLSDKIRDYLTSSYYAELNHAMYKFSTVITPLTVNDLSTLYFQDPFFQRDNTKTKIVFIHGWDFTEKQTDPPTDFNKKISNILSTWNQALAFTTSRTPSNYSSIIYNNFEIYVFTYRTSDYIEFNGRRFIDTLNKYFAASDKVIVVAHSMGGLVSRSAILHPNNTNDVIDHIVSLGTPYYGSPFSSPQYTGNLSSIGTIIKFMTNTPGGKNLAYTNGLSSGVNPILPAITDGLDQAFNPFLEGLIANHSKDAQTTAYAGDISSSGDCSDGTHDVIYQSGCLVLSSGGTPPFPDSDGIVPWKSALMNGHLTNNSANATVSDMDHSQMSFRDATGSHPSPVSTHFDSVFNYIFGL